MKNHQNMTPNPKKFRITSLVLVIITFILFALAFDWVESLMSPARDETFCLELPMFLPEAFSQGSQPTLQEPEDSDLTNRYAQPIWNAISFLENQPKISIDFFLKMSLFGQEFKGAGNYHEVSDLRGVSIPDHSFFDTNSAVTKDDSHNTFDGEQPMSSNLLIRPTQFRFQLKMFNENANQPEKEDNYLEVVCNPERLWMNQSVEKNNTLSTIEIEELINDLNHLDVQEQRVLNLKQVTFPCLVSDLPGLGGFPGMLRNILALYQFDTPPEDVVFEEEDLLKMTGVLRANRYERFAASLLKSSESPEDSERILETLPTHIELYLGKEIPFPYRIRYTSQTKDQAGNTVERPLAQMDFVLSRSQNIAENFNYRPSIGFVSIREKYVKNLLTNPNKRKP